MDIKQERIIENIKQNIINIQGVYYIRATDVKDILQDLWDYMAKEGLI